MSDAIVLTSQQPGAAGRSPRSSAPQANGPGSEAVPAVQSLVPEGGRFEGTIAFDRAARLDGHLVGPIEGRGRLEVGATGVIEGDVHGDEVVVAGRVRGEVEVTRRLELRAEARVEGPVTTPSLRMHEGAILDGPVRVVPPASDPDS